jgi:hypothetical protein
VVGKDKKIAPKMETSGDGTLCKIRFKKPAMRETMLCQTPDFRPVRNGEPRRPMPDRVHAPCCAVLM